MITVSSQWLQYRSNVPSANSYPPPFRLVMCPSVERDCWWSSLFINIHADLSSQSAMWVKLRFYTSHETLLTTGIVVCIARLTFQYHAYAHCHWVDTTIASRGITYPSLFGLRPQVFLVTVSQAVPNTHSHCFPKQFRIPYTTSVVRTFLLILLQDLRAFQWPGSSDMSGRPWLWVLVVSQDVFAAQRLEWAIGQATGWANVLGW